MAFRKHDQESYSEKEYEEEEEEKGSLLDRASHTLKGLFSRRKEDDYDYDEYDDSDDYDDFEDDFVYTAPAKTVTEDYAPAEEYEAEAWGGDDEAFFDFDAPETEQYGETAAYEETGEDPFARFAAALEEEEGGEAYYAPETAEGEMPYAEDAGEEYADYSVFDYGDFAGTAGAESEEYADAPAEDYAEEDYAAYYGEDYAEEDYADYGEYAEAEAAEEEDEEEYADYGDYEDSEDYEDYADYEEEEPSAPRTRSHSSGKGLNLDKLLVPALGVLALCAVAAILFAIVTLLGTRDKKEQPQTETPVIAAPTATPTPAELQATGAAESETPSNMVKAVRNEAGALVPAGDNAVVPSRGVQLDLDSFATSTFIGNSFVEGMQLWSDIDSGICHYVCADGVSLDNMIGNYLYFVTVRNYDSIYLTLGINEIGWPTDSFIAKYEKVIDYIRSDASDYSKKATIYITSVFPTEEIMETVAGESGQTIHKDTILKFNEALKEMCARKGCWYLDVYSALAGPDGYLPADVAADDHIHFEKTGYRIWTDYLRNHYVDESMVG